METKPTQNTSLKIPHSDFGGKSHSPSSSECHGTLQVWHTHHSQLDAPSCHCERCRTAAPASTPYTHTSPGRRSVCSLSVGRTCRVDWPGLGEAEPKYQKWLKKKKEKKQKVKCLNIWKTHMLDIVTSHHATCKTQHQSSVTSSNLHGHIKICPCSFTEDEASPCAYVWWPILEMHPGKDRSLPSLRRGSDQRDNKGPRGSHWSSKPSEQI